MVSDITFQVKSASNLFKKTRQGNPYGQFNLIKNTIKVGLNEDEDEVLYSE